MAGVARVAGFLALGAALGLAGLPGPGAADPEIGSRVVTRLWLRTADGPAPACTGAYVRDPADRLPAGTAWLLTARHCAEGGRWAVGRDGPERALRSAAWRPGASPAGGALLTIEGVALARAVAPGGALVLAERMAREGPVWIHGFPFGIEHVTAGRVLGDSPAEPGSVEVRVVVGPQTEAGPGFSGAPVIGPDGRLVGLLWALRHDARRALTDQLTAFVIPVEAIRPLLSRLAAPR
jgi:hypothetical protein